MNYIWSDLHINHEAVIRYEDRPFRSVEEMNKTLLKNWRDTVTSNDTLFNLGDVAFRTAKEDLTKIVKNLPGKKILVLGNHDRSRSVSWWRDVGFDEVYPYPIIYEGFFILSHEPIYVGPEMPYVNIHGHTHRECFANERQRYNACVENIGYTPVSLDVIIASYKGDSGCE